MKHTAQAQIEMTPEMLAMAMSKGDLDAEEARKLELLKSKVWHVMHGAPAEYDVTDAHHRTPSLTDSLSSLKMLINRLLEEEKDNPS
jgi:hypothetical protein